MDIFRNADFVIYRFQIYQPITYIIKSFSFIYHPEIASFA